MSRFFLNKNNYFSNDRIKLVRFPRTPEEIQDMIKVVNKYTDNYFYHVLLFFIWVYIL